VALISIGGTTPSPAWSMLYYGDTTYCITDSSGNQWSIAYGGTNDTATLKNGAQFNNGGCNGYMLIDASGNIWITQTSGSAVGDWWWTTPTGTVWNYNGTTGPSSVPICGNAMPVGGSVPNLLGQSLMFGDTGHVLVATTVGSAYQVYWINATGTIYRPTTLTPNTPVTGGTLAVGDLIEFAPTTTVTAFIWVRISGAWYYLRGADNTLYPWNGGPAPQPTNGPASWAITATPIATASPQLAAGPPYALVAMALNNAVITPLGQSILAIDIAHSLAVTGGGGTNIVMPGVGGQVWIGGYAVAGPKLTNSGDIVEAAPTTTISSNIWAQIAGVWYYWRGADNTFYQWNTGPAPQPTNGPQWALTAVPLTVGSPSIGAVTSSPGITNPTIWITSVGSPTTAAPQGTTLPFTDLTHCIFDSSHKSIAFNATAYCIINGGNSPYGGSVAGGAFYEIDYTGAVWVWSGSGGQWYNGPTAGLSWQTQPHGPTLALTAAPLTVGSPQFAPPAFNEIDVLAATPLTVGSPALGMPPLVQQQVLVATAITTVSPGIDAPPLGQKDVLSAIAITTASPGIGSPLLIQAQVFGGVGVTPASPTFGASPLLQVQVLSPTPLAVGSPAFGSAPLGQIDNLTAVPLAVSAIAWGSPSAVIIVAQAAVSLTVGSPALGAPVLQEITAFTAVGVTPASPSIGAPTGGYAVATGGLSVASPIVQSGTLAQVQVLAAAPLTVASPAIGIGQTAGVIGVHAYDLVVASPWIDVPALGQIGALAAVPLILGSPALGAPAFGAIASPGAVDLAVGSPIIPALTFTEVISLGTAGLVPAGPAIGAPTGGYVAYPTSLATSSPGLGAPTLRQIVALAAVSSAVASPVIPAVAIGVTGAMTAVGLAVASPQLDAPFIAVTGALAALPLTVGAPAIGAPSLGATVGLTATSITVSSPVVPPVALTVVVALGPAPALVVGSPTLGVAALSEVQRLVASALVVGSPAIGAAVLAGTQVIVPRDFVVGSPALDAPTMSRAEMPPALDINVGSPVMVMPTLTRFIQVILSSSITGQIEATPPVHGSLPLVQVFGGITGVGITAVVGPPKPLIGKMPTVPAVPGSADIERVPIS
jgi:hypothetical protein